MNATWSGVVTTRSRTSIGPMTPRMAGTAPGSTSYTGGYRLGRTGTEDRWLGGPAAMWWSQADSATYRGWLEQAGVG